MQTQGYAWLMLLLSLNLMEDSLWTFFNHFNSQQLKFIVEVFHVMEVYLPLQKYENETSSTWRFKSKNFWYRFFIYFNIFWISKRITRTVYLIIYK